MRLPYNLRMIARTLVVLLLLVALSYKTSAGDRKEWVKLIDCHYVDAGEPVVQEAVVQRHVELRRLLPLEVGVGVPGRDDTAGDCVTERIARAVGRLERRQRRVGRDAGIALQAVPGAQPQLREAAIAHERLFADAPRPRHRREQRPFVS